jgi:hypothetical protein
LLQFLTKITKLQISLIDQNFVTFLPEYKPSLTLTPTVSLDHPKDIPYNHLDGTPDMMCESSLHHFCRTLRVLFSQQKVRQACGSFVV